MAKYITAAKFRTMAFGSDVSELSDLELESLCAQASMLVDVYCNASRIPQQHDFKGGTITGEEHSWRYPFGPFDIGQRRLYPYHWPIISIERFRIYVTRTQYVEIAPTELVINNSERFMEVVSLALTSSGLFNALIIPNVGLATPKCVTDYHYGWDFEVADEVILPSDARLWRAENQFWFASPAPVVKVNGTIAATGYTVDLTEGTIVFDAEPAAGDVVAVSYHHRLPREVMFAAGRIATDLHGEAELAAKGMTHLNQIRLGDMALVRTAPRSGIDASDLAVFSPQAALYLQAYRLDGISIR